MKKLIKKKINKLKKSSFRTKNVIKHIFSSFFFKTGALLANFALIPIAIDYLGTNDYGIWLTISSFVVWFSFFDVGLGNGLRNKLSQALTNNNIELAKNYISVAYTSILAISIAFLLLFLVVNYFINWQAFFNIEKELHNLMLIIVICFSLKLTFSLIIIIYLANQNHSIQVKIHFFEQVLLLLGVWFLTNTTNGSLEFFTIIFSVVPLLILIVFTIFAFSKKYYALRPKLSYWNKKYFYDIMGLGVNFFLIQISAIILFSTDNYIITKLFGADEVVPYTIAFKYFSIVVMIFTLIVNPYWSSFTEAFAKHDILWIKKSIRNLLRFWSFVPLLLFLMVLLSNTFFSFWVGDEIDVPFKLSLFMALYTLIFSLNMIFVFFLNGVGKIRIQLIISVFSMIVNIPLSIFFAKNCNLGTSGIILATTISILISAIVSPIQYYKIINFKSKGIWNA